MEFCSRTYCSQDGSICGYFVTVGAYGDHSSLDLGTFDVQNKTLRFTKGFSGEITYVKAFHSNIDWLAINENKCLESTGSCFDQVYIDCTNLNQGIHDGCTNQSTTPGSMLQYFFP